MPHGNETTMRCLKLNKFEGYGAVFADYPVPRMARRLGCGASGIHCDVHVPQIFERGSGGGVDGYAVIRLNLICASRKRACMQP